MIIVHLDWCVFKLDDFIRAQIISHTSEGLFKPSRTTFSVKITTRGEEHMERGFGVRLEDAQAEINRLKDALINAHEAQGGAN